MFEIMLGLITALLAIGILFKIIKSVFIIKMLMKLFGVVFLVLILLLAYTGYSVYKDYKDFSEKFSDSETLFIITYDKEIASSLALANKDGSREIIQKDISSIKKKYPKYTDDLLEDYFKIIVIDAECFEDMQIELQGIKISYNDIERFLDNDDISLENIDADLSGMDKQEIKDTVLAAFTVKMFNNPNAIITNIRDGKIQIIEETIIFKLIKDVPKTIIGPLFEKNFLGTFGKIDELKI